LFDWIFNLIQRLIGILGSCCFPQCVVLGNRNCTTRVVFSHVSGHQPGADANPGEDPADAANILAGAAPSVVTFSPRHVSLR
jgi:hypothetical protein